MVWSRWHLLALIVAVGACASSTATECEPGLYATGYPNPDGQAVTSDDIEVWGLFYPSSIVDLEGNPIVIDIFEVFGSEDTGPRRRTKIVWRATGEGEFSVEAHGPTGGVVQPFFLEEHGGSNWGRPGGEWGTLWEFSEPGCWTFVVRRGEDSAEISIVMRFSEKPA